MRFFSYISFLLCLSANATGQISSNVLIQDCNLILSGNVLDKGSNIPLHFSSIYIQEVEMGTVTDEYGNFQLRNLCSGEYHIEFSHIGCEPEVHFLRLEKDSVIKIYLHHHAELLDEVVVHGHREDNTSQASATVSYTHLTLPTKRIV